MFRFGKLGFVLATAVLLNGCVIVAGEKGWKDGDWQSKQNSNRQLISELALSTSTNEVLAKMGTPAFSDAFVKEGVEYRILRYRTQRTSADGETSIDETTPLVFKNNQLIGWGDEALKHLG